VGQIDPAAIHCAVEAEVYALQVNVKSLTLKEARDSDRTPRNHLTTEEDRNLRRQLIGLFVLRMAEPR
jgi:phage-related baseplate assembly protein